MEGGYFTIDGQVIGGTQKTADYLMAEENVSSLIYDYFMGGIGFMQTCEDLYDGRFYGKSQRDLLVMVLEGFKRTDFGLEWRIKYHKGRQRRA